jgi:hypothetical protein
MENEMKSKLQIQIDAIVKARGKAEKIIRIDGLASYSLESRSGRIISDLVQKYEHVILVVGARRRHQLEGTRNAVMAWYPIEDNIEI